MFPSKPDLVILPFRAALIGSDIPLTLEQALLLLRKHVPIQIERSQPGLPDAIGWAIFRRTPRKYLYENAPFRFECGVRRLRSVRKRLLHSLLPCEQRWRDIFPSSPVKEKP